MKVIMNEGNFLKEMSKLSVQLVITIMETMKTDMEMVRKVGMSYEYEAPKIYPRYLVISEDNWDDAINLLKEKAR